MISIEQIEKEAFNTAEYLQTFSFVSGRYSEVSSDTLRDELTPLYPDKVTRKFNETLTVPIQKLEKLIERGDYLIQECFKLLNGKLVENQRGMNCIYQITDLNTRLRGMQNLIKTSLINLGG